MAVFSNHTILVVEDEKPLALALQKKLNSLGAEVDILHDGSEVIAQIFQRPYSLVLLDIGLPQKDGFAVLRELRDNPKTITLPVILLTNFGDSSQIDRGTSLGASDYLIKANTSLDKLEEVLGRYLRS